MQQTRVPIHGPRSMQWTAPQRCHAGWAGKTRSSRSKSSSAQLRRTRCVCGSIVTVRSAPCRCFRWTFATNRSPGPLRRSLQFSEAPARTCSEIDELQLTVGFVQPFVSVRGRRTTLGRQDCSVSAHDRSDRSAVSACHRGTADGFRTSYVQIPYITVCVRSDADDRVTA